MSDESNTAKEDGHTKEKDVAPSKEVKVAEVETATKSKEGKHSEHTKKKDKETGVMAKKTAQVAQTLPLRQRQHQRSSQTM